MPAVQETVDQVRRIDVDQYKYGFETQIESEKAPKGLSEDTIRFISAKKNEPEWMLNWRLDAYRRWLTMHEPKWAKVEYGPIDYQDIYYYSAPKTAPKSLDEIDPEILRTYEKLGIPLREREALLGIQKPANEAGEEGERGEGGYGRVAVDAVFDSVSVATTFKAELAKAGVLFMPISEAVHEHPELVKKYLGTVVPVSDNFFATLNSAVFSDGSFVYVPPGVRCPMELSTYFRINERNTGQFERTLIVADKGSYVSYLEGCTAPMRDENQLHAAVVDSSRSTTPRSSIRPFRTGIRATPAAAAASTISSPSAATAAAELEDLLDPARDRLAITWKYPSCILRGDNSRGEFYSIAISNGHQQVDSGTKMLHLGKNTTSRIISKGIAAATPTTPIAGSSPRTAGRRARATSPIATRS
jgi:ABC-type transport system involved in Fe-S cluster assembly, permease component